MAQTDRERHLKLHVVAAAHGAVALRALERSQVDVRDHEDAAPVLRAARQGRYLVVCGALDGSCGQAGRGGAAEGVRDRQSAARLHAAVGVYGDSDVGAAGAGEEGELQEGA